MLNPNSSIDINLGDHKFSKDISLFTKVMLEKIKKSEVKCEITDIDHIIITDSDTIFKITHHIDRLSLLIISPGEPKVFFTGTEKNSSGYKKLESFCESVREFFHTDDSLLTERERKAKEVLMSKILK